MTLKNDFPLFECHVSKWRRYKNITQKQLAEFVGVTRETIGRMERGYYVPRSDTAFWICKMLNKSFEELFEFK